VTTYLSRISEIEVDMLSELGRLGLRQQALASAMDRGPAPGSRRERPSRAAGHSAGTRHLKGIGEIEVWRLEAVG
jgi:hypothetical protein